ncbi:MAG: site-specific integrase, partial [Bradyrhizobium sp.]|nr:site-specific integrase [Bradyrhizobium sp.]
MKPSDERLIDLYLDMLAAERGAAANTLEAYRRDLTDFSADLSEHGSSIAKAGTENIRDYLGRLAAHGFSASSVARRLSAIRQLYRFLYAEGNRKDDPAAVVEGPKRGRSLPKVLSVSHVDQLLAKARKEMEGDDAIMRRVRAARLNCLLEVLYATGMRVSELVALPASAAQRDQRMLIVRGKGNKERLVPLNESAKAAMRDYLTLCEEAAKEKMGSARAAKWLFPSFGASGHLTRQHFARDLKALATATGLRA